MLYYYYYYHCYYYCLNHYLLSILTVLHYYYCYYLSPLLLLLLLYCYCSDYYIIYCIRTSHLLYRYAVFPSGPKQRCCVANTATGVGLVGHTKSHQGEISFSPWVEKFGCNEIHGNGPFLRVYPIKTQV